MNLQRIQNKKSGISPIIATLLLILIAIAAGVIVYAYVVGFIGNSTTNSGNSTSVVSIDNACVSQTTKCTSTSGFYLVIRNVGSTTVNGVAAVYLSDITAGSAPSEATVSCTATSVAPGGTFTCSGSSTWTNGPTAGDTVALKVVMPDGGSATTSVKAIG